MNAAKGVRDGIGGRDRRRGKSLHSVVPCFHNGVVSLLPFHRSHLVMFRENIFAFGDHLSEFRIVFEDLGRVEARSDHLPVGLRYVCYGRRVRAATRIWGLRSEVPRSCGGATRE